MVSVTQMDTKTEAAAQDPTQDPTQETHGAVDPLPGSTGEGSWFLVGAVVVEAAAAAGGWQAAAGPPAGTLGQVAVLVHRGCCRGPRQC